VESTSRIVEILAKSLSILDLKSAAERESPIVEKATETRDVAAVAGRQDRKDADTRCCARYIGKVETQ